MDEAAHIRLRCADQYNNPLWKKFRHHGIGNAVCSCPLRISRENTVQILTIFIDHTHGTMFKSTDIDQRNDDHISLQFLRLKFFRKFHRRLYSYILGCVLLL